MVFLVVYGHMIELLIHKSPIIKIIYLAIYSFHMPAFVIVSGMLTRADMGAGRIKELMKSDWHSSIHQKHRRFLPQPAQ